jgi:anthranilate/para-aminobenzoate synthase component I
MKKKKEDCQFYSLIGFDFHLLEGRKITHEFDKEGTRLYQLKRAKKKYKVELDKLRKRHKEFLQSKDGYKASLSPKVLGIFKTKEEILKFIEKYQHQIHEGNYYQMLLIERRFYGYEGYDLDDDAETWFQGRSTGYDWYDYEYTQCDKPEMYHRTMGFL